MVSTGLLNFGITISCLAGLGLSIYSYIIELQLEQDDKYQPYCDISEHVSCSKVFHTPYGKGFGIMGKLFGEDSVFNKPNSLVGILAYSLLATLAQSNSKVITRVSQVLIILTNFLSVYLAYLLYFIIQKLCVVCVVTYLVNFINLLLTNYKLRNFGEVQAEEPTVSKKKKAKRA